MSKYFDSGAEQPRLTKPDMPCKACPLYRVTHTMAKAPYTVTWDGVGFCDVEGFPYLGVGFMGEASDMHAEVDGLPLRPYSKGGSIHTRTLRSLFVSRNQVM